MAGHSTRRGLSADRAVLGRFAALMRERHGAEIHLFGSRARGDARADSDYDVVAVSPQFAGVEWYLRCPDALRLWFEAGGWGIGLDLQCYTPDEFAAEIEGYGYLGSAHRRGELRRVPPKPAAA